MMRWHNDGAHDSLIEAVAAVLAAIREAKMASIGGGIAISSAIWSWLGLNYQPMALAVGACGVMLSACGVVTQLRRHRTLSADEDRRYHLEHRRFERDEARRDAEHQARMAILQSGQPIPRADDSKG